MTRSLILCAVLIGCRRSGPDDNTPAQPGNVVPPSVSSPFIPPTDDEFELTVQVYTWQGLYDASDACYEVPCEDYQFEHEFVHGEQREISQRQSWPVYVTWESNDFISVPELGLAAALGGEVFFNPWEVMDIGFCRGSDCDTRLVIQMEELAVRSDCKSLPIVHMYDSEPQWYESMGEAYGVSNLEDHCTNWRCTDDAPRWACPAVDLPNETECEGYGCECNIRSWDPLGANHVLYDASVSKASGVLAPWIADRWESGGIWATMDSNTVFRQTSEVKLSRGITFRPVVDMRLNWVQTGDTHLYSDIPAPDGFESPPLFSNEVNDFIAPPDGFWPITWEFTPPVVGSEVWMLPIWALMVYEEGVSGTAEFRNLAFEGCGPDVDIGTCDMIGCSYL